MEWKVSFYRMNDLTKTIKKRIEHTKNRSKTTFVGILLEQFQNKYLEIKKIKMNKCTSETKSYVYNRRIRKENSLKFGFCYVVFNSHMFNAT
jgi:hypothetical protein